LGEQEKGINPSSNIGETRRELVGGDSEKDGRGEITKNNTLRTSHV